MAKQLNAGGPGRIARMASVCLAFAVCLGVVGAAPERLLTEFDLVRPAFADGSSAVASSRGGSVNIQPAPWRVVAATGVPVYRELEQTMTDWRPVTVGLTVESYAEFDTGRIGRMELFNGYDRVILATDTSVALPPVAADIPDVTIFQGRGQAAYEVTSRRQSQGGLMSRLRNLFLAGERPTGGFEVYTPHLVAAVKGTAFRVTVDDEAASVAVTEGVVSVSETKGGAEATVKKGKMATAGGAVRGLAVGATPENAKNRTNNGRGNSQGGNSQGGNGQGGNGQGGDGDSQGGDGDSQGGDGDGDSQ
ncbi:MAG: FecR domain-containing protein [Rhodospirillales bacterium]|nr:MAG: FecR domain-containing protein [Rhodospirillales bacterium]